MSERGDALTVGDEAGLRRILEEARIIAMVGLSSNPDRPSFGVAAYLQAQGYRIIPVNPNETAVLGERAYPTLLDVPREIKVDLVDLFRRSEEVDPHIEEAVRRGDARVIWMQDGVVNFAAAKRARAAGLAVVMNDCTARRHRFLVGPRA